MSHHDIKCHTSGFLPIVKEQQKAIVRINDRDYKVGDTLTIHQGEMDKGKFIYSGDTVSCQISYIDDFAVQDQYVSLSLSNVGMLIIGKP